VTSDQLTPAERHFIERALEGATAGLSVDPAARMAELRPRIATTPVRGCRPAPARARRRPSERPDTRRLSDRALWRITSAAAACLLFAVLALVAIMPLAAGSDRPGVTGAGLPVSAAEFAERVAGLSHVRAERIATAYALVAPPAGQPAPFVVVNDVPYQAADVYTGATVAAPRAGLAPDYSTVWADCQTFVTRTLLLQIRWPNNQASEDFLVSRPTDPYTAYLDAGNTVPAGHNGRVPVCSGTG
jgi:hypothetical protein